MTGRIVEVLGVVGREIGRVDQAEVHGHRVWRPGVQERDLDHPIGALLIGKVREVRVGVGDQHPFRFVGAQPVEEVVLKVEPPGGGAEDHAAEMPRRDVARRLVAVPAIADGGVVEDLGETRLWR